MIHARGRRVTPIEHYEPELFRSASFDLVSVDENNNPKWKKLSEIEVRDIVECSSEELSDITLENKRLFQEIEKKPNVCLH